MKISLKFYNENRQLLKEQPFDTLQQIHMKLLAIDTGTSCITSFLVEEEAVLFRVMLDEDVLLESSIDDLVYEYNLDTLQKYEEVQDYFNGYYPNDHVKTLANLKKGFSKYVSENLSELADRPGERTRMSSITTLVVGEGEGSEEFNHEVCTGVPEGYNIYFYATNLDPDMLMIIMKSEDETKPLRANFRHTSEITDYTLSFMNHNGLYYASDLSVFVSYSKHHPNYKDYKDT